MWRVSRPPFHTDVNWLISPFSRNFAPPNENSRRREPAAVVCPSVAGLNAKLVGDDLKTLMGEGHD
jgi:hypothetical protein